MLCRYCLPAYSLQFYFYHLFLLCLALIARQLQVYESICALCDGCPGVWKYSIDRRIITLGANQRRASSNRAPLPVTSNRSPFHVSGLASIHLKIEIQWRGLSSLIKAARHLYIRKLAKSTRLNSLAAGKLWTPPFCTSQLAVSYAPVTNSLMSRISKRTLHWVITHVRL